MSKQKIKPEQQNKESLKSDDIAVSELPEQKLAILPDKSADDVTDEAALPPALHSGDGVPPANDEPPLNTDSNDEGDKIQPPYFHWTFLFKTPNGSKLNINVQTKTDNEDTAFIEALKKAGDGSFYLQKFSREFIKT